MYTQTHTFKDFNLNAIAYKQKVSMECIITFINYFIAKSFLNNWLSSYIFQIIRLIYFCKNFPLMISVFQIAFSCKKTWKYVKRKRIALYCTSTPVCVRTCVLNNNNSKKNGDDIRSKRMSAIKLPSFPLMCRCVINFWQWFVF